MNMGLKAMNESNLISTRRKLLINITSKLKVRKKLNSEINNLRHELESLDNYLVLGYPVPLEGP
jgi:hypothetical protein